MHEDGGPRQGAHHATQWLPGEVVKDRYATQGSSEAQSGQYGLRLGAPNVVTGGHLAVWVEGAPMLDGHVEPA